MTNVSKDDHFSFPIPFELSDEELLLVPAGHFIGDEATGYSPCYRFEMRHRDSGETMGRISLLISNAEAIANGAGHSGFSVLPEYRGKHYAARSIRLIASLARYNGMNELIITTKSSNAACRKSCLLAGATPVNPPSHSGEPEQCRYRLEL